MARIPYHSQTHTTATISLLEGLLQLLREKGIISDAEVRSLFTDRAEAWDGAVASPLGTRVAALLRSMAGPSLPATPVRRAAITRLVRPTADSPRDVSSGARGQAAGRAAIASDLGLTVRFPASGNQR